MEASLELQRRNAAGASQALDDLAAKWSEAKLRRGPRELLVGPACAIAGLGLAGGVATALAVGAVAGYRRWRRRQDLRRGLSPLETLVGDVSRRIGVNTNEATSHVVAANVGASHADDYTERVELPAPPAPGTSSSDDDAASELGRGFARGAAGPAGPGPGSASYVERIDPYKGDPYRTLPRKGFWYDGVAACKARLGVLSDTPAHRQAVAGWLSRYFREIAPDIRETDVAKHVPYCTLAYFVKTDVEIEVERMWAELDRLGRIRKAGAA